MVVTRAVFHPLASDVSLLGHGGCLSKILIVSRYNSAFYASLGVNDYKALVVTPGFLDNTVPFNRSDPDAAFALEMQELVPKLDVLDNAACIRAYARDLLDQRRNLLLVTDTPSNHSLLRGLYYHFAEAIVPGQVYHPYEW
jgi:hypothetical protein